VFSDKYFILTLFLYFKPFETLLHRDEPDRRRRGELAGGRTPFEKATLLRLHEIQIHFLIFIPFSTFPPIQKTKTKTKEFSASPGLATQSQVSTRGRKKGAKFYQHFVPNENFVGPALPFRLKITDPPIPFGSPIISEFSPTRGSGTIINSSKTETKLDIFETKSIHSRFFMPTSRVVVFFAG